MLSASIWDTVISEMATSASKSPTARATRGAGLKVGRRQAHAEEHPLDRVEGRRDICRPREVTDDDVGAEREQGIGAVVVVGRRRVYGPAALTQQRHTLAAHAADSPAGTGHQDETRLSHRPPPFVIPAILAVKSGPRHIRRHWPRPFRPPQCVASTVIAPPRDRRRRRSAAVRPRSTRPACGESPALRTCARNTLLCRCSMSRGVRFSSTVVLPDPSAGERVRGEERLWGTKPTSHMSRNGAPWQGTSRTPGTPWPDSRSAAMRPTPVSRSRPATGGSRSTETQVPLTTGAVASTA